MHPRTRVDNWSEREDTEIDILGGYRASTVKVGGGNGRCERVRSRDPNRWEVSSFERPSRRLMIQVHHHNNLNTELFGSLSIDTRRGG